MPDTTKRIAVYARTAAIHESVPNFSMDGQVRQCAEFALRAGFEIVQDQIYQETVSDNATHRPILEALFEAAKAEEFDMLLVSDYSRLAAKPSVLIGITRLFAEMGEEVISVSEPESAADNIADEIVEQFRRELILSRTKTNRLASK